MAFILPRSPPIDVPVLMLHGDVDPHPGLLIAEDLREYIPHLEYVEFAECGHSPWLERRARTAFFSSLIMPWIRARIRKPRRKRRCGG